MIPQFALRLLLGMGLTWAVLPRRQITSGFFRIQLLVALGLSALATVTFDAMLPSAPEPAVTGDASEPSVGIATAGRIVCGVIAVIAYVGSVLWTLERRRGGTMALFLIVLGTAGVLAGSAASQGTVPLIQRIGAEFTASAILGSCVTAMLLGHWYLTTPTMSIAPLSRANGWFAATILLRASLAGWGYGSLASAIASPTHGVWLALRWIAGIVLPALLSGMVFRILQYRNTQSATGVLFAGVILVFIGELAATLLSRELGVPF